MKRIRLSLLLVTAIFFGSTPSSFAIDNLKLNGQSELTITAAPYQITMTCDLADEGNTISVVLIADWNQNGELDDFDRENGTWQWYKITDGIGWIWDQTNPLISIPGDDTGVDGHISIAVPVTRDLFLVYRKGIGFLEVIDEDGSSQVAKVILDVAATPPVLSGQVTDAVSGAPLHSVRVYANQYDAEGNRTRHFWAPTDAEGQYSLMLYPGRWTMELRRNFHQPLSAVPDTFSIVLDEQSVVQQDFAMPRHPSFLDGTIQTDDGTPVSGVIVGASPAGDWGTWYEGATDASGYYQIGLPPGDYNMYVNTEMANGESIRPKFLVDPMQPDGFTVANGATHTQDFTTITYTAWLEGTITLDGVGVPNLEMAASVRLADESTFSTFGTTDETGHFLLGVFPGELRYLAPSSWQYRVLERNYTETDVVVGDTLSDLDIEVYEHRSLGKVTGKVTDSEGTGIPDAVVIAALDRPMRDSDFIVAKTDAEGVYLLEDLAQFEFRFNAAAPGMVSQSGMVRFTPQIGETATDFDFVLVSGSTTAAEDNLPGFEFELFQNYPNPSVGTTVVTFSLPEPSQTDLSVFDMLGRKVNSLIQTPMEAGVHSIEIDASNLTPGVYFYRLVSGEHTATRKFIVK